jgi:hypothetical protein
VKGETPRAGNVTSLAAVDSIFNYKGEQYRMGAYPNVF